MPKTKLMLLSLLHSLGVLAYIALVAKILANGERIFPNMPMPSVLGAAMFLTLFVLSAAIVGALVLGRPIMLYLDSAKADAIKMFLYTIGWMFLFLAITFLLLAVAYWNWRNMIFL